MATRAGWDAGATKSGGSDNKNSTQGSSATEGLGTSLATSMRDTFNAGPVLTGLNQSNAAAQAGAPGLNDAFNWAKGTVDNNGYNPALTHAQDGVESYLAQNDPSSPVYQALKQQADDNAMKTTSALFTGNGRFGSGSHVDTATTAVRNADANLESERLARVLGGSQALGNIGQTAMGNAAGAASATPSLYSGTLLPGQAQAATDNPNSDWQARYLDMLRNLNGQPGTQEQTPWWQSAGSLIGTLL